MLSHTHIRSITSTLSITGTVIATALASTASADVVYTQINNPPSGEASHTQILQSIYGGDWSLEGARDLSNGLLSATRLADSGSSGSTDTRSGILAGNDQRWAGALVELRIIWKDAGDQHSFGWFDDSLSGDGTFQAIGSTSDHDTAWTVMLSDAFRWGLHNHSMDRIYSSRESDNSFDTGPRDQLVTYQITGHPDGDIRWLLFWEDRMPGDAWSDDDFNDAVIEVRSVPAPGSLALLMLAGLMARSGAARRRRQQVTTVSPATAAATPDHD